VPLLLLDLPDAFARLLGPVGVKVLVAENSLIKQHPSFSPARGGANESSPRTGRILSKRRGKQRGKHDTEKTARSRYSGEAQRSLGEYIALRRTWLHFANARSIGDAFRSSH